MKNHPTNQHLVEACERAARAGGKVLLDWVGRFQVREKGPADLVTEADLAAQEAVRAVLMNEHPDFGFVGEESSDDQNAQQFAQHEYQWIVDPLDGTTNYVHQMPGYAVSIALARKGAVLAGVVFDPVANECYSATAGGGSFLNGSPIQVSKITEMSQALVAASFAAKVTPDIPELKEFYKVILEAQTGRRLGSAALNLCYLAAGRFDAYWAGETKVWDIAAGSLIVQEAGGAITALNGGPFIVTRPRFLAASTPQLHAQMLNLVHRDVA